MGFCGEKVLYGSSKWGSFCWDFFPLFHIIVKSVELLRKNLGEVLGPQLKPPSPSPHAPKPSSSPERQLGGSHQYAQGCYWLPDACWSPPSPHQDITGHMALDLPLNLLSMPSKPVPSPSGFTPQNGGGNVASPVICLLLVQIFPPFHHKMASSPPFLLLFLHLPLHSGGIWHQKPSKLPPIPSWIYTVGKAMEKTS